MKTVLYFYPKRTSFVSTDAAILKEKYIVKEFLFDGSNKLLTPIYFLLQFCFILFNLFSAYKMVSQFAGYHSFLPSVFSKVFRKQHIIVLNGTECNNFPEYNYGYIIRPLLFWFSKKSMAWATKLLPVSESLVQSDYTYKETLYNKQGFKAFYKNIVTPIEVVYNGVSPARFHLKTDLERDTASFITVATGLNSDRIKGIKGLDLVIELAAKTPQYKYTFIGAEENDEAMQLPANINVVGFVKNEELEEYYNAHAFYLQLSVSEGFGIAVCEAMLCGCVPIVSNVGILPEIAGKFGYVLDTKDTEKLLTLVEVARKEYQMDRLPELRDHVVKRYDIAIRRNKLHLMLG